MTVNKKYPCTDIIKRIQKLNDGEKITIDEMDELRNKLSIFPQCKKYLNAIGLKILNGE